MKRMGIAVLACALAPWAGALAFQNQNPPPPQRGEGGGQRRGMPSVEDQVKDLGEKLQLTDGQKTKVKAILEDQRTQMQNLMKDDAMSREDSMTKMRSLREAADGKIRDILNDDQKKKYDQILQERRDRMRQRQQGGDAPK
jgi:periplasmic protein CpxP/Spy